MLDDESDELGFDSGPSGTYYFRIFLCVLTSTFLVLVFCDLTFSYGQESIPKVVAPLHSFGAQIPDFTSKFKNHFYSYSLSLH